MDLTYQITSTLPSVKYYYLGSQRVAMRQGNDVYYLHGDHLGSTSLTTNLTGTVLAETRHHPFGEVRWQDGVNVTDFGFTGQRNEVSFGLMDYNARFYSPGLRRFVSADSIIPEFANSQAWNHYTYVDNNPLKFVDPTGHCKGLSGTAYNSYVAVVNVAANIVHKANDYREDIFFPDGNTTFADRLEASTVIGGGATLIAAGIVELAAGTLTTAATTGATTTVGTTGSTAGTLACRDGDCTNEIQAISDGVIKAVSADGNPTNEVQTLYRAVSQAEYQQIMKTGNFQAGGGAEGKYFATTLEHAQMWGEKMMGVDNFRIIQVKAPSNAVNEFYHFTKLDMIGPAYYASMEQLHNLSLAIQEAIK